MTKEQLKNLEDGDLVRHTTGKSSYIVVGNYGGRVTAVRIVDITNAGEWDIVRKVVAFSQGDIPDFTTGDGERFMEPDVPKPKRTS